MPTGRKTKLTAEVEKMITNAVALGVPVVSAALVAGIARPTVLDWLQRGRGEHPTRPATPRFVAFADAIEKARAQDETRRLARLEQAARGGAVVYEKTTTYPDGRVVTEVRRTPPEWTSDAWYLERSRPETWGRQARVDLHVSIQQAAAKVAAETGLTIAEVLAEAESLLTEVIHDAATPSPPRE